MLTVLFWVFYNIHSFIRLFNKYFLNFLCLGKVALKDTGRCADADGAYSSVGMTHDNTARAVQQQAWAAGSPPTGSRGVSVLSLREVMR